MNPIRRALLAAGLGLCATALGTAHAQNFPDKPVTILIGTAPGGITDTVTRMLAHGLGEKWGQSVVVEGRTGASGTIAGSELVRAKPDGYTLWVSPQTSVAVAPQMLAKAPYDPLKDLTPITVISSSPMVLVASPSFPPNTFAEYVEYVRERPGQVNFASGGVGSAPHMTQELLNHALGLKMNHIPYRGEAPALKDVLGGEAPVLFANIPVGMPHVRLGKLKALVTTGATRSEQASDVPTMKETGIVDFTTATWNGLYGPPGMAPELVQQIASDVKSVYAEGSSARARMIEAGNELVLNTPQEFEEFLRSEVKRWGEVIEAGGLRAKQ